MLTLFSRRGLAENDNDFDLREIMLKKNYLIDELVCVEQTLAKRRTELTEANQLLAERELEFTGLQKKVSLLAREFTSTRQHLFRSCFSNYSGLANFFLNGPLTILIQGMLKTKSPHGIIHQYHPHPCAICTCLSMTMNTMALE